jgi:hypothetical protein
VQVSVNDTTARLRAFDYRASELIALTVIADATADVELAYHKSTYHIVPNRTT